MENNEFLEPIVDQKIKNNYTFYFDEDIREPSYYRYLSEILASTTPDDSVTFVINSGGGNAYGMTSVLSAMSMCVADIHGILVGDAMSAASAIFLACNTYEVGDFSSMMIHTASYGLGGKHTDVGSSYRHTERWIENFVNTTYSRFLSKEELEIVINGRDLYFTADEIAEKLSIMVEREAKEEEEVIKSMLEKLNDENLMLEKGDDGELK